MLYARDRSHPPDHEAFERGVVWTMYTALQSVRDEGYSDWQTLTSFFANLLLDQDNPHKMLKQLFTIPERSSTSSATSAAVRSTDDRLEIEARWDVTQPRYYDVQRSGTGLNRHLAADPDDKVSAESMA